MLRSRVVRPGLEKYMRHVPHNTFDDELEDLEPGSLSVLVNALTLSGEARILGDKGLKRSLNFSIGTVIQSRTSPPQSTAVFALSNDISHTYISHSEVT